MYNKNTFINWKQMFRRTLAVGLSIVMIGSPGGSVNVISRRTDSGRRAVRGLLAYLLSNDVQEQKPEIGASEDATIFPIRMEKAINRCWVKIWNCR